MATSVSFRLTRADRLRTIGFGVLLVAVSLAMVRAESAGLIYVPIGAFVALSALRTGLTVDPAYGTVTIQSTLSSRVVRIREIEGLRLSSRGRVALVARPEGSVLRASRSFDTYLPARLGDRDVAQELATLLGVDVPAERAPFELSTRGQMMLAAVGAVFVYIVHGPF
jgi:hypothetical protein